MEKQQCNVYLNIMQPFFKEGQHLWELVVRVYIIHSAAALLQQADDALILDLFMHLELLKGGAQWLKEWAEIIVVGEVGVWQLWENKQNKNVLENVITRWDKHNPWHYW